MKKKLIFMSLDFKVSFQKKKFIKNSLEIDMTAKAMIKEETEASTDWNNIISKTFSNTKEKYYFVREKNESKSIY